MESFKNLKFKNVIIGKKNFFARLKSTNYAI
jgi:hypothetical protein